MMKYLRKFRASFDPYYMESLKDRQESRHIEVWNTLADMKRAGLIEQYSIKDVGLYNSQVEVDLILTQPLDAYSLERSGFKIINNSNPVKTVRYSK